MHSTESGAITARFSDLYDRGHKDSLLEWLVCVMKKVYAGHGCQGAPVPGSELGATLSGSMGNVMGRRGPKPLKADAIAHSALALFVEKGVKGATTREIARRAHTTEGSLYRYYTGKDDLARRVLTRSLVDFAETVARALEGVSGPRLRLRAFVRAYIEYSREHPLEHAFVRQSNSLKMVGVPDEILRPRRILADILADGMASGEFLATDPRLLAPFISGGLSRTCPVPGEEDRPTHSERSIHELCDLVERVVCVDSDAAPLGRLGSPA